MTNPNPAKQLKDFQPKKDFFVGIDSDGCVFDTMEIKQKECFIPNIIKHWHLQPISKFVRQAAEFVNLYSPYRGINRWPALIKVFDLLTDHPEVINRNITIPLVPTLRQWIENETNLSNPNLLRQIQKTNDPILIQALKWSLAVNADIAEMVHSIPPFPWVLPSLEKISAVADIIVVSQTPTKALTREWREHHLAACPHIIAGQEMGPKSQHLALTALGKYPPHRILMIGDAPGDRRAARDNHALFYPIIPGAENQSWQKLHEEAFDLFLKEKFAGPYQKNLNDQFDQHLPNQPPWTNT